MAPVEAQQITILLPGTIFLSALQASYRRSRWALARSLRIADGPDAVHLQTLGKLTLKQALARAS